MKKVLPLALCLACVLSADVITLKGGHQISGQIESATPHDIRISGNNGAQVIAIDQVQSVQFGAPASTAAALPQTFTLPAGTEISIRTIDAIDSRKADSYREYAANLDDPLLLNGITIWPASTTAVLRVTDIQHAGFKRPASLSLSLIAVNVSNQRISMETAKLDSQSGAQGKRTLAGTGIGAGTGALIGSATGGLGALIGAGIGATAGAVGAKALGKHVEIAPETRFTFKLTQPVAINNAGNAR